MADLGGSIITGIDGNPLATLIKQMGVSMLDIRTDTPLFMSDGSEADKGLDEAVRRAVSLFNSVVCVGFWGAESWGGQGGWMKLCEALFLLWWEHKRLCMSEDMSSVVQKEAGEGGY